MSRHPDLRPLIDQAQISAGERQALLGHAKGCPACRAALAAEDSSRLFALLAVDEIPAGLLDRVSEAASRASGMPRAAGAAAGRRLAVGSLAASLLLALALGGYLWTRPASAPDPPAGAVRVDRMAAEPDPLEVVPAGMVDVLDSPGEAEVLEIMVGQARLVMIFDEALDI